MVASDRMEFAGIPSSPPPVSPRVAWSAAARLGSHEVLLVANGAGASRAAAAVDAALESFRPEALVSTGFCGALIPELNIADIVVGSPPALPVAASRPYRTGPVCTIDHVARTAEEKSRLAQTGAIAVEMEAAGVSARAQTLALPFYCVKAVTDLSGETMANDLNRALRSDGRFDTIEILRGSLRRPLVRLPELIRLRNRSSRSARSLGDFFADCRF